MRIQIDFDTTSSTTFGDSELELLIEGVQETMYQVSRKVVEQLRRRPSICTVPESADIIYDLSGRRIGTIVVTPTEDENAILVC